MFLAGINFALYYVVFHTRSLKIFKKDSEFRLYALIVSSATVITAVLLYLEGYGGKLVKTITDSAFQVVSIITTTGMPV
jgi:trk system potassium uptake protein TrkH